MSAFSFHRVRALWRSSTPLDRTALGIILVYALMRLAGLAGWRPPLQGFAGFLSIIAVGYLLIRQIAWLRAKLLWSLRNRLIVAYLFIAVVPVVLLLGMAGLAAYLTYLQLGAHLLHDDLQERINKTAITAEAIAAELLDEQPLVGKDRAAAMIQPNVAVLLEAAKSDLPGVRADLNRGRELLRKTGGAAHFAGIVETEKSLWLRAVVERSARGSQVLVSVSVPVSPELLDSLTSELGPIQLTVMRPAATGETAQIGLELYGRRFVPMGRITSRHRVLGPKNMWLDIPVNGGSTLEAFALESGEGEAVQTPVIASFTVRPSQLNLRLLSSLGALGEPLAVVLLIIAITFLVIEVAALITGIILTRTITHAVSDLYDATQHVRRGDFGHRVRLQRRDQLGVLGESFNAMTSSIAELIEEQRQRQRLENELSIAREVQSQLFPQNLPSLAGVQLAAICRAARVVSGDYYDLIRLGPTRIGIAVADISGKGISAALLMASLQAALRSQALLDDHASTAELTSRLNRHLYVNTSDDRYATFFYAVYDTSDRTLAYTNAGHVPPFYVANGQATKLEEGGTVVGLFDHCDYEQRVIQVAPGSLLVAYSDGIIEPENVYGEEFGTRRLMEEVLRRRDISPHRLAEDLVSAAEQWGGSPEQADDMTVLIARLE